MSITSANAAIRSSITQAERVLQLYTPEGRRLAAELEAVLRAGDEHLADMLDKVEGSGDMRFTEAQAAMFRKQAITTADYIRGRLLGLTEAQALSHIAASVRSTVGLLARLNEEFEGLSTPLRVREASVMLGISNRARGALIRDFQTSTDRYGYAMIRKFEQTIATGLVNGLSKRDMVRSLVGMRGPRGSVSLAAIVKDGRVVRVREENIPEGLFTRYKSWAVRIVRTETAHAYNTAGLETLREARDLDFPDLQKKIMATFDNRTAYDSAFVHGQIRAIDGVFTDGAGRVYQRPPARPNDRETVIPWRGHWPETQISKPKSREFVASARAKLTPNAQAKTLAP